MGISKNHPYWTVRNLIENEPEVNFLVFSYYYYVPQTIEDDRFIFYVKKEDFLSERYVINLLDGGREDCELAIHSTVILKDRNEMHIPMIDMSTSSKAHLEKLRPFINWSLFDNFVWFYSGRSFHGYGNSLLSATEWIKLMGSFLLSNAKDMKPLVDPRWIGHRLLAGYSTLRWTNRTEHYMAEPTKVNERYLNQSLPRRGY